MKTVWLGMSSCNVAAGSGQVWKWLEDRQKEGKFRLLPTGCLGLCYCEPQLRLRDDEGAERLYTEVTIERVQRIFDEDIVGGKPVADWLADEDALVGGQRRVVLERCGHIDPEDIDDALAHDGYRALRMVVETGDPCRVIEAIEHSGLRGRGGGGFPTGAKWRMVRAAKGERKYVICNADEGDPGAFMDRAVLESDPHAVLEGIAIAAFATGAQEAIIYCRAEYPLALQRLRRAIEQGKNHGFWGPPGTEALVRCDIQIREGAGAFVCGEETALIASLEGRRGMPRPRPPFPAQSGLFGCPTLINNVETFANVPWILRHGASAFAACGTKGSPGTKVFALAGSIRHGGLVEVPMGITLEEILSELGGGARGHHRIKAVQLGGPSGGCLPRELFHTRIDYDELRATGAIMGSGGMVVLDDTSCMVDVARYFLDFACSESCGKCTFCRIGTVRMREILTRICEGQGCEADLTLLAELAGQIRSASLCGLGQTAPNPVLSTLRFFADEYREHVHEKFCRAGRCRALCAFAITPDCVGCGRCAGVCPAGCISGGPSLPHRIDRTRCVRCGACREICPVQAVAVVRNT